MRVISCGLFFTFFIALACAAEETSGSPSEKTQPKADSTTEKEQTFVGQLRGAGFAVEGRVIRTEDKDAKDNVFHLVWEKDKFRHLVKDARGKAEWAIGGELSTIDLKANAACTEKLKEILKNSGTGNHVGRVVLTGFHSKDGGVQVTSVTEQTFSPAELKNGSVGGEPFSRIREKKD
jgi:hypothetical protein